MSWVRKHFVHLGINVSSSAHYCGCTVDNGNAVAANLVLLFAHAY